MTLQITLADFLGNWRLRREIEDRRLGVGGVFDGRCVFSPERSGLWQCEDGVLRFGEAAPMRATRRYFWEENGEKICLFFEDGRDFHAFVPSVTVEADHLCGADHYQVRYDFSEWPFWRSRWRVTGPRKDLVLTNEFSRIQDR